MSAIYNLITQPSPERVAKMVHPVPSARIVEREIYILTQVKDRVVLDIGATGPMHEAIIECARKCYGIDVVEKEEEGYFKLDIDKADYIPLVFPDLELIVAGEVIEHLSNAGHFLDLLYVYDCPIILTTPNAFSEIGALSIRRGIEQVNREHVC